MDSTISERILYILEKKELSKTDFAKALNITPAYVSKMVNKGCMPSDRLIEDICEKFFVNEDWLRNGGVEDPFIILDKKDELLLWANRAMKDDSNDYANRFANALLHLDIDDWELLANMAELLVSQRKKDSD